ncbi:MAG: endonuclease V [Nitrososphaeraceae archaeon]
MELQKRLARQVVEEDTLKDEEMEYVCGIDVSYVKNTANCSALIMKRRSWQVIEAANMSIRTTEPYIPGLLMIREAKPLLATLKLLKKDFDLLLIDGHGVLHPRRCGLACFIGMVTNKPTIGVGKHLLCGTVRKDHFIDDGGQIIGCKVSNARDAKKSVYVSVGNLISLVTSIRIVQELTKEGHWIPEPLRLADINSKNKLNFQLKIQGREDYPK